MQTLVLSEGVENLNDVYFDSSTEVLTVGAIDVCAVKRRPLAKVVNT